MSDREPTARAEVITIETPGLGDRSYLVHDGSSALVVDPQRDIDRVLHLAESLQVQVTHVLETHLHNDYVTGGLALAEETGARYVVPAGDAVEFERTPVGDGAELAAGSLTFVARHTPGHTPHHMAYVVRAGADPVAVFTGGSMLFGAVGRTDLIAKERTEELTRAQFRSVRRLAHELPGHVAVHPTHGFGSFCSATETSGEASTIADERDRNIALVIDDEDRFVTELLGGLSAYPRYYAHMASANAKGPAAPDLSPPEVIDPERLAQRLAAGEWVVDLRSRRAFARSHLAGTVSIELGDPFAVYLGWTLPWQAPITLVGDSIEQVGEARRQLVRIGFDALTGAALGPPEALGGELKGYPVASFDDLALEPERDDRIVLDVRREDEWSGGHLTGALHIPFFELAERVGELPEREIWVHCKSGFRAAIATSLLDRAGLACVLIDDDWERADKLGLAITTAR
ncbi:MAG: MBL fold metallo-hydrolase [Actinomycetota bacterium]|nr:MBL fold metallo-hydrolase [Actinomycetota bacterium]